jgi:hypothetical protein
MNYREWEAQQSLIHRHGNRKFIRPTKRTEFESPVFQRFDSSIESALDRFIFWGCAVALCVAVLLLIKGVI